HEALPILSFNTFSASNCAFNFGAIQFTIPFPYNRNSFYPLTLYHKTVSLLNKYEKFCNTVNRYSFKTVSLFSNMLYYLFFKFQSVHSQKNVSVLIYYAIVIYLKFQINSILS